MSTAREARCGVFDELDFLWLEDRELDACEDDDRDDDDALLDDEAAWGGAAGVGALAEVEVEVDAAFELALAGAAGGSAGGVAGAEAGAAFAAGGGVEVLGPCVGAGAGVGGAPAVADEATSVPTISATPWRTYRLRDAMLQEIAPGGPRVKF